MNFGDYRPGNSDGTGLLGNGTQYVEPGSYQAGVEQVQGNSLVDPVVEARTRGEVDENGEVKFIQKLQ